VGDIFVAALAREMSPICVVFSVVIGVDEEEWLLCLDGMRSDRLSNGREIDCLYLSTFTAGSFLAGGSRDIRL